MLATVLITALLAVGLSMSQVEQYTAMASLLFRTASDNVLSTGGYVDRWLAATNASAAGARGRRPGGLRTAGRTRQCGEVSQAVSVIADPGADVAGLLVGGASPDERIPAFGMTAGFLAIYWPLATPPASLPERLRMPGVRRRQTVAAGKA